MNILLHSTRKIFWALLLGPLVLRAQTPAQLPPGGLMQLQVAQPTVDVSSPVTASAVFDPPVVRVGEKTFYRVTMDAAESSIQWPETIFAPSALPLGKPARGQITQFLGNNFRSLTTFLYEVRPRAIGHFAVTNFPVIISGRPVEIPLAGLEVVAENASAPPRQLLLESSATNIFVGQPFRVRVLLPAGNGNEIEALREIQYNGDGLLTDKTTMRQSIEVVNLGGQLKPVFLCELTVTPIAAGPLTFFAQGYTAGREFTGPISIRGQVSIPGGPPKYVLLISDPVAVQVHSLPPESGRTGFTGTIGKFFLDPPQLSTNRMRVGQPVRLKVVFHGEGDLTRFVPPVPPRVHDWQIIADKSPATSYTLIPQTDETRATPAIPFSYFDPTTAKYVDLSIPPLPVTVFGEGLPVQVAVTDTENKTATPTKLSDLASRPGKTVASLQPLQLQGWFIGVQLLPVLGLLALWQWDQWRRFLAAHPEIVRRRQARRALRREKRALAQATAAGDAKQFVHLAANALKIAVAPHFPAHPQALVCAEVLAHLDATDQTGCAGETVRKIFAAADAQFAANVVTTTNCLEWKADFDAALQKLEEKL